MQGPIFHGKPSPSLKKMQRLTTEELQIHVQNMEKELSYVAARIEARKKAGQTIEPQVMMQWQRLDALISEGKRLLSPNPGNTLPRGAYRSAPSPSRWQSTPPSRPQRYNPDRLGNA